MSEPRLYPYVGPREIRKRVEALPAGRAISSQADIRNWIEETDQEPDPEGYFRTTFVIDAEGTFRIEDYGYEHVACAAGGPVQSAGVAWFEIEGDRVSVAKISNQSTGFCPEDTSWPPVQAALDSADIPHPGEFTQQITFRLCTACGQRNIVKDDWFYCGVCDAELPRRWNFDG